MMNSDQDNKKWRCLICGYIHVGQEPPYACPICNAPQKMFKLIVADRRFSSHTSQ